MSKKKLSLPRRALGGFCHYCPLCRYARKRPDSLVGRILHYPLHADHCPAWNAEKIMYSDSKDEETPS